MNRSSTLLGSPADLLARLRGVLPTIGALPLLVLVAAALAARAVYATQTNPHVDEYYQVWGAANVAANLSPQLPSGVLYMHGLTETYLIAPLYSVVGLNPAIMRIPSVLLGGVAVWIGYLWTVRLSGRTAGLLAAAFLAFEPHMIVWGGRIRMYQLLIVLVLAAGYATWRGFVQDDGRGWRVAAGVFTSLAALTHFAGLAFIPLPAILVGHHVVRRRRLEPDHLIWATVVAVGVAVIMIPRITAPWSVLTEAGEAIDRVVSLPGAPAFDPAATLAAVATWLQRAAGLPYAWPVLVALALWLPLVVIWRSDAPALRGVAMPLLGALLPLALFAIARPAVLSVPRYFLPAVAMLAPVIGNTLAVPVDALGQRLRLPWQHAWRLALVAIAGGALLFAGRPVWGEPLDDLEAAYRYVAARREPGEVLVTQNPVIASLVAGDPGHYFASRLSQISVITHNGRVMDRWTGSPVIATRESMCRLLDGTDAVWLIISGDLLSQAEAPLRVLVRARFTLQYSEAFMQVFVAREPCTA